MLTLRPSSERGAANHGWLDTKFSFSFAHYYDPKQMGFGPLRVINEDYIEAGKGFGTHPHDNMEIITYPISGSLAHKDSMNHASIITAGMIQKMSAGTGVRHSEFNPEEENKTHLLQIWIVPDRFNIEPNYEELSYKSAERSNMLQLLATNEEVENTVHVQQSMRLYRAVMDAEKTISFEAHYDGSWIQLISGELSINGVDMKSGDGLAIRDESSLTIACQKDAHFLLFDLKL